MKRYRSRERESRSVSIVTPERKEAKLVRLLLSKRRRNFSDSDESPVGVRKRINFDAMSSSSEHEEIPSIEDEPVFYNSISRLQYMTSNYWGPFARDGESQDLVFLKAVVGDNESDLDRFLKWSKWNKDTFNYMIDRIAPVSEYVRSVMRCLVRTDIDCLKKFFIHSDRKMLLKAIRTPFGKLCRTLLHAAALHDTPDEIIEVFRFLPIPSGDIVIKCRDAFGMSPLDYLSLNSKVKNSSSFQLLSRIGGYDSKKQTMVFPLHYFALSDHKQMVDSEFFACISTLEGSASRSFSEQRTPLMAAIMWGSLRAVEGLVATNTSSISTDRDGITSIHLACSLGRPQILRFLLPLVPERLKMKRCAVQGSSPFHAAAAGGTRDHAECIEILFKNVSGSEIASNLRDFKKWTPLLYALFAGSSATISACLAVDRELIDSTWGRFPQLQFTLGNIAEFKMTKKLEKLFLVPEFFNCVNEFLTSDISRLGGPLGLLLEVPFGHKMLTMSNKIRFLEYRSFKLTRENGISAYLNLNLPRLSDDQSKEFFSTLSNKIKGYKTGQKICCGFLTPDSDMYVSGSGPTREFFSISSKYICEHLFRRNSSGTQLLPSENPGDRESCYVAGWLTGVSLLSHSPMNLHNVSKHIWRYLLEGEIGYSAEVEDLVSWDPQLTRSLQYILQTDIDSDENIQVMLQGDMNQKDKAKFVSAHVDRVLKNNNFTEFRNGFLLAIPEQWIVDFFDSTELAILFAETQDIDTAEWRAHTHYTGYKESDPPVQWFWEIVESVLTKDEKRLLLMFSTGMTAVPVGGFASLESIHRDKVPFTIYMLNDIEALPTAATCFNMLRLPAYPNKEMLRNKLLAAIRFGSTGFSFE